MAYDQFFPTRGSLALCLAQQVEKPQEEWEAGVLCSRKTVSADRILRLEV